MKRLFPLFFLFAGPLFGDHLNTLSNLSDEKKSFYCPYFENVASNSFWYQWKVDHPGSSSLTLSQVKFYSNASGTYNTEFSLASNTFMFDGAYIGGPRLSNINGFHSQFLLERIGDQTSEPVSGPTCPDGSPSVIIYIHCPSNSLDEVMADIFGNGGDCLLNNHRGFQSKTTGKIYLSTGLWESQ